MAQVQLKARALFNEFWNNGDVGILPPQHSRNGKNSKCYPLWVIVSFGSRGTGDVFRGINSPAARRCCPAGLREAAQKRLDRLELAKELSDLMRPPGNRLEPLRGRLEGWHSIRINSQWRIVFRWTGDGPDGVEIVDYHA